MELFDFAAVLEAAYDIQCEWAKDGEPLTLPQAVQLIIENYLENLLDAPPSVLAALVEEVVEFDQQRRTEARES